MTGLIAALNVLFSVLSDAGFAAAGGCLLAIHWLNIATGREATGNGTLIRLRRILLLCVAGMALGQIVHPWFAAASMGGSDNFANNLALIPDILSSTHQGKVWYLGSLGLVALVATLIFTKLRFTTAGSWAFGAALTLVGCAKAASGHAAGDGDFTLAEIAMLLHIAGTAVWAGAVIASGLIVVPDLAKLGGSLPLWSYATLLSRTVTRALIALSLSGIYTSWRELNQNPDGLWSSEWGKILLVKITLVSIALAMGAVTRFKCVQCPATSERAALMVRLLRAEALSMIVILCLSALLANTAPAMADVVSRSM